MAKKLDINPWITMWYEPRKTIRKIIEYDPRYLVIPLMMISGFSQTLDRAVSRSLGDIMGLSTILIGALIIGPIIGIINLYIGSSLLRWTGRWIGGKASYEHIQTAIAWSQVPGVWALILWVPYLALFGEEIFKSTELTINAFFMSIAFIEIAISIWALIIYLRCLSEVQRFSIWKALLNSLLSVLVVIVPLFLILFVLL